MIELETAKELIQEVVPKQLETEEVSLLDSLNRISGETVVAKTAVPTFSRSGMDGYAVYSDDIVDASPQHPVSLIVSSVIYAGDNEQRFGERGTAARIMTGAPVPAGYDTVVKQEETDGGVTHVLIYSAIEQSVNIGKIGEDISGGTPVLLKHKQISPDDIGLLASLGIQKVKVLKPLKVGIISTGNEVVNLGSSLAYGQIYNSNLYVLSSYIQLSNAQLVIAETLPDNCETIAQSIEKCIEKVDLLITIGGVSVGEKDLLPDVMAYLSAHVLFHKINIKPGTPVMASTFKDKLILSLSGNPYASTVNFHLFYWSIVSAFFQCPNCEIKSRKVKLAADLPPSKIRRFIRAYEEEGTAYFDMKKQRSSVRSDMLKTNGMIEQKNNQVYRAGDWITIYYWPQ